MEQGRKRNSVQIKSEWLYRKRVQSFEEMTNHQDLIAKLNDQFVVQSRNNIVQSLLMVPLNISLNCLMVCWWGVLMRQHYGLSVCADHSGWRIGCTFCASGFD